MMSWLLSDTCTSTPGSVNDLALLADMQAPTNSTVNLPTTVVPIIQSRASDPLQAFVDLGRPVQEQRCNDIKDPAMPAIFCSNNTNPVLVTP